MNTHYTTIYFQKKKLNRQSKHSLSFKQQRHVLLKQQTFPTLAGTDRDSPTQEKLRKVERPHHGSDSHPYPNKESNFNWQVKWYCQHQISSIGYKYCYMLIFKASLRLYHHLGRVLSISTTDIVGQVILKCVRC